MAEASSNFDPREKVHGDPIEMPHLACGAMAGSKPYRRGAQSSGSAGIPGRTGCRLARQGDSAASANCSTATRRCGSTSIPASNAAPAPTSAIISSARRTPRTCRSRARTCCARSIAAISPSRENCSRSWSAPRISPRTCSTTGIPISISAPSAAAVRCSAPMASTPPKSPWPRATSWTRSAWGRNIPTRSSARSSASATTSACRPRP